MKRVTKKVLLFPNAVKKDTLISYLLRSELNSEKGTLSENFRTHMLTHIVKVVPRASNAICSYVYYTSGISLLFSAREADKFLGKGSEKQALDVEAVLDELGGWTKWHHVMFQLICFFSLLLLGLHAPAIVFLGML